jgi:uncharacterized membrane protein
VAGYIRPDGHDLGHACPLPGLEHRIELAPNCSLTPRGARIFVGSVAALTFGVALFFTLRGFWPVLPFAGLEIGLLAWAVSASRVKGLEREVILVSDETS